jgi:diguanylate cyclase (GGDEF)-like protein/PAS domain S-box-containing protein
MDKTILLKAVESSNDGIIITELGRHDDLIVYCNPAFERLTGYSQAEILGRDCRFLQGHERDQKARVVVRQAIEKRQPCRVRIRNFKKTGELFYNELGLSPVSDAAGTVTHYVGIQKDISDAVRTEQRFAHMATHDMTTGLLNNRGFFEAAQCLLNQCVQRKEPMLFVVMDVDQFKVINDRYGHMVGDDTLQAYALNMQTLLPKEVVLARIGGDEFVLCSSAVNRDALWLKRCMRHIVDLTQSSVVQDIKFSVSYGCVIKQVDAASKLEEYIRHADLAMYQQKKQKCLERV